MRIVRNKICRWRWYGRGFKPGCGGGNFDFNATESGYNFCPCCGGRIVAEGVPAPPEDVGCDSPGGILLGLCKCAECRPKG